MDDERWEAGMPVLDRQGLRPPAGAVPSEPVPSGPVPSGPVPRGPVPRGPQPGAVAPEHGAAALPPSLRGLPPRSVPEAAPTPLQRHYINLSVIVLICGAVAITALEIGAPLGSPLVKLSAIIAAPLLVATTADAILRIWRSAWAWMPVDRTRGAFRLAWVAVSLVGLLALVAASVVVILA